MNLNGELSRARPPDMISALLAGFDSVTNHLGILVLPIALDLFLWLGPKIRVSDIVLRTLSEISAVPVTGGNDTASIFLNSRDFWEGAVDRINIFSALRSFPVGIPSLMVGDSPLSSPIFTAAFQFENWSMVILTWFVLGLIGLFLGTLFFLGTAQVSLEDNFNLRNFFSLIPWTFSQVFILTLAWLGLLLLLSIPASILISLILSMGSFLGQVVLFLVGGFLLWVFFPLVYSLHGIFAFRIRAFASVKKSIRVVQMTLPTTALFVLALFVIDQGLGLLWVIPDESSWFTFIGIVGHAFVASALLSASFIYYRDADHWLQFVLKRFDKSQTV